MMSAQGGGERFPGLPGQPVDQVDVHAREARLAAALVDLQGLAARLPAADGLLHSVLEVLDAQADAVEPGLAQEQGLLRGADARVDLQGHLGVRGEREAPSASGSSARSTCAVLEVVGRAAAPVQLDHLAPGADDGGHHGQLALDPVEVARRPRPGPWSPGRCTRSSGSAWRRRAGAGRSPARRRACRPVRSGPGGTRPARRPGPRRARWGSSCSGGRACCTSRRSPAECAVRVLGLPWSDPSIPCESPGRSRPGPGRRGWGPAAGCRGPG